MNTPHPSDSQQLQPDASLKVRIWQLASSILIVGGALLIGWGGWLFYEQQVEAGKPPPAPIVDSAAMLAGTGTPPASDLPTATLPASPTSTPPAIEISPAASQAGPIVTPSAEATGPSMTAAVSETGSSSSFPADDPGEAREGNPFLADVEALRMIREAVADELDFSTLPVELVDTPVTRLVVESIDLDTPVVGVGWTEVRQGALPVRVWTVAEHAAGWHKNSTLPGQGGNIVLSGHHNIRGEVFRDLVEMEIGDAVTLFMGDQSYGYVVDDKFIVKDKGEPEEVRLANARWIGPFADERVTLVTCWPYNNNTHRVIVIAKPAALVENEPLPDDAAVDESPTFSMQAGE